MPLSLHKLNLSNFRNYETLRLEPSGAKTVVLAGANGAGKTNILEAVSLLSPGRGLRGAALPEMQGRDADAPFAVSAEVETAQGTRVRVGTGLKGGSGAEAPRRVFRIDGRDAKSAAEVAAVLPVVWLTPQMDGLFMEGASGRRRFLDRLAAAFDPAHAERVGRAERNLRGRLKVLQTERLADPVWLSNIEAELAADFSAISAARLDLVQRLSAQGGVLSEMQSLFPVPRLSVSGAAEELFARLPALEAEDEARRRLKIARGEDAATGRTGFGTHRSDLAAVYAAKGMDAAQCSTGEQKGLLISIVLSHALVTKGEKGYVPVLLLDEVAAHLDAARRAQLFAFLQGLEGQSWLTGTEDGVFDTLRGGARFYTVEEGRIA